MREPHTANFTVGMRKSLPDGTRLRGAEISAGRWPAADWDPRLATGAAVPATFAATFAAAATMSALRGHMNPVVGVAVMAALVSLTGWIASLTTTALTAGVAWLMLNGFVEDRYGVLRWHGRGDVTRLGVLVAAAATVAVLREAQIRRRRHNVEKRMSAELAEMVRPSHETSRKHLG